MSEAGAAGGAAIHPCGLGRVRGDALGGLGDPRRERVCSPPNPGFSAPGYRDLSITRAGSIDLGYRDLLRLPVSPRGAVPGCRALSPAGVCPGTPAFPAWRDGCTWVALPALQPRRWHRDGTRGAAGDGWSRPGPAGAASAAAALPCTARSGMDGFVWRRGDFANYRETDTKNGQPQIAPRLPKSLLLKSGGEVGYQGKAIKCMNNYTRNSYEGSASIIK